MFIIGSFVSPYVRKVLACLNLKHLAYEVDPITPFFGNAEFARMSPLRRIPVLVDGDVTLCDSSVIAAYLDESHPGHPLFPAAVKDRARARWLEEFADTRMGDVFICGLFYQRIVHPNVWGEPGDAARVEKTLAEDMPAVLDYLEAELPADGFLFGDIGVADISIATFFRNGSYAGFEVDTARWPKVAAFVARTLAHPCLADLYPFERIQLSTSIAGRRQALLDAGAPLTPDTVATHAATPGVMRL
jgi:glutathione S-transferase